MADTTIEPTLASLSERLRVLHRQTQETPLFNPVFQLSLDISRKLESGELSIDALAGLVDELEAQSLDARADRLRDLLAPQNAAERLAGMTGPTDDFDAFRAFWEQPHMHAVFTAHPTFLLSPQQSDAVAAAVGNGEAASVSDPHERPEITLGYEHDRAMAAMANAQDARDRIVETVLASAQQAFPDRWHEARPLPFRFASWVGYDMDGRTDIKWYTSIAFRLAEKAQRLDRYAASLEAVDPGHAMLEQLHGAAARAHASAAEFAGDLSDPADLSAAANRLTADHDDKLLSLQPLIDQLESEARSAEGQRAVALRTLAAAMRADGLGMGWIHFRVNAKQLHNAIRTRLGEAADIDL